jgi:hypothetical protein
MDLRELQEGRSALHHISEKVIPQVQSLAVAKHRKIVKIDGSLTKFG